MKELFDMIKKKQTTKFINAIRDIDTKKLNKYIKNYVYLIDLAIILNNKKILQALLDKGVNTRSKGKKSLYLIRLVIKYDNISLIKILFDHDNKLINYKDNDENTPLHIAILYNDIKALKIILDYGANINSIDKNKNTPLHVACILNKTPLIHLLFKYNPRINTKNIDGRTPLMLSTEKNNLTICRELINRGANINAQESHNALFPLYIAGYYNYFKLIKYYLTIKNININLQTNQGYTILMELISNIKKVKSSDYKNFLNIVYRLIYKYHIDVNIYNEFSETTLHILLNKDKKCKYFIGLFEILIKNTIDLNVKDTNGNSILHLIIKNNCFTRLKPFLKHRKLDIFSKDIEGKTVFDSSKKSKSLLNFVINNYLTLLMKNNYKMKWQQICSNYNSDKKKIIKYIKNKNNDYEKKTNQELCKLLIKEKIVENKQSFPENPIHIDILKKPLTNISNFGGYDFETLFGLLFLLKRHKKDCAPINFPYKKNKKLVQFLKKHNRYYHINNWPPVDLFEIFFFKSKVFFPVTFEKNIKSCIRKKFRYVIIPVFIVFLYTNVGHANFIIYDIKENIVERFEPYGIYYDSDMKQLDIQIKKKFKKIDPTIQYYPPKCLFSTIGIQAIEEKVKRTKWKGDPGGFCDAWSLYYADLRLSNPKIPRKELLTYTIKKIREKDTLRNFIRNYIQYIMRQRDKVLKKAGINIHNWINHNYTDVQFKQVKEEINTLLKELVKKYTG